MNAHAKFSRLPSRRDLLKGGGALIIGFSLSGLPSPAAAARGDVAGPPDPNTVDTWIAIHADNSPQRDRDKCCAECCSGGRGTRSLWCKLE